MDEQRTLRAHDSGGHRALSVSTGFPTRRSSSFSSCRPSRVAPGSRRTRPIFCALWRRPLELFVTELCQRLVDVYPGIADAEPHFFRIQRDTRFSKGQRRRTRRTSRPTCAIRPPLRRRAGARSAGHVRELWARRRVRRDRRVAYVAGGAAAVSRRCSTIARQGAQFQKLVDALVARGFQVAAMEKLKRVPPPYAQDHPRAELLKHKGLAVMAQPRGERQRLAAAAGLGGSASSARPRRWCIALDKA